MDVEVVRSCLSCCVYFLGDRKHTLRPHEARHANAAAVAGDKGEFEEVFKFSLDPFLTEEIEKFLSVAALAD